MRAAIAECRRRTVAHIALPANERFTLEFVTGKSWGGYNWYKGDSNSLIQVNTDLPVRIGRAVDLGCHEGYPGHHVYNMLLEQKLAQGARLGRVHPLPALLAAELHRRGLGQLRHRARLSRATSGSRFETRDPLSARRPAGDRTPPTISRCRTRCRSWPAPASPSPRDYLEGRIDRAQAIELTQQIPARLARPGPSSRSPSPTSIAPT